MPEIKWMKDGMTVGEGNTLILEALRNKTGQYLCLAYNGLGGAIKTRFHLDVQCKYEWNFFIKMLFHSSNRVCLFV